MFKEFNKIKLILNLEIFLKFLLVLISHLPCQIRLRIYMVIN